MKKLLLVAAVVSVGLASCKKDYTCTCTTKDGSGNNVSASATYHAKKKDAQKSCDASASTAGTYTTTCSLN